MQTCVNGHSVPANASFCGTCGAPVRPEYADTAGDATPLLLSPPAASPSAVTSPAAPVAGSSGFDTNPTGLLPPPPQTGPTLPSRTGGPPRRKRRRWPLVAAVLVIVLA